MRPAFRLALALSALCVGPLLTHTAAAAPAAPLAQGEVSMQRSATLKVPGATLYYEVWGSGPLLLVIPGGPHR